MLSLCRDKRRNKSSNNNIKYYIHTRILIIFFGDNKIKIIQEQIIIVRLSVKKINSVDR